MLVLAGNNTGNNKGLGPRLLHKPQQNNKILERIVEELALEEVNCKLVWMMLHL